MGCQKVESAAVFPEVGFGADEDERDTLAEVRHLWMPLSTRKGKEELVSDGGTMPRRLLEITNFILYIRQADGEVDGKADQDDVRFRVAQWPQAVVFFLSSGVPQSELDQL